MFKKLLKFGQILHRQNYTHPEEPRHAAVDRVRENHSYNGTIRVVSYNIKFARKIAKAIQLIRDSHNLHNADIICLQEMDHEGVRTIADELGYNYVYYPAVLHPSHGRDFGNAILSKWPIIEDEKIILPMTRQDQLQRIAVRTRIKIHERDLHIFCIHMDVFMGPHNRSRQIVNLMDKIPPVLEHCIVAGDFNTFTKKNRRAILNPFVDAGFKLATEEVGWTFRHWFFFNKKNHLDHIYTRGLTILEQGKVINHAASDHLPIWVTLQ